MQADSSAWAAFDRVMHDSLRRITDSRAADTRARTQPDGIPAWSIDWVNPTHPYVSRGPRESGERRVPRFHDGADGPTTRSSVTAPAPMSSSLLARVEEEIGAGAVTELRVVGPSAPSWNRGTRRSPDSRGPRDTYG